ncbi:hypothetical protein MAR_021620, partial [Mya arenaria]
SVTNEVIKDFQKLPDVLQQGGQLALDGLTDAGNHALDGLKDLGNQALGGITDFGNTVGNGIKNAGLFGRRRRMYDVSSHDCMERCDDVCLQLMTDDNDRVITDVCGAFVVSLNKTVHRSIVKTTTVYNATLDTAMPILTKVEIDTSDLDPSTMEINTFYITVNIGGHYVRFRSSEAYRMMDVMGTARLVAAEVWQMWT